MPDSAVFIRPDVSIDSPAGTVVSHPRVHNFQNAAQVALNATDLGIVDVQIGLGRDIAVSLGAETTIAGSGSDVLLVAGDAVTAGAGGGLTIASGDAIGAGVNGGVIALVAGAGGGGGACVGGVVTITAGGITAGAGATGGAVTITAGSVVAAGTGSGGAVSLTAGNGAAAAGGTATLRAGNWTGAGAGVGAAVFITAGTAGGATQGGNIDLTPGSGTPLGVIRIVAATATSVQPTTTNVVSLGTTTLAYAAVYSRIFQTDTGQTIAIIRGNGDTVMSASTTGTPQFPSWAQWGDTSRVIFGAGNDVQMTWATASANNALHIATGVNTAAQSGNILLTTSANIANEHGLAAVATPRLAIFSAADMSVVGNRTQYIQMYHDGTNGILTSGSVSIVIQPRAGITLYQIDDTTGATNAHRFTQRAGAAGSPNMLLMTAAAHVTLAASTEAIDLNFNLARTVQFATGALALQRAVIIQAPTYGFVGASTLTTTATFVVTACPTAGTNATFTNPICAQFGGAVTIGATSAGLAYRVLDVPDHTVTVTGATQVTSVAGAAALRLGVVTLSDASAVTVDRAATLYIAGPPVGGGAGPVTITAPYAIHVDAGTSRFDGNILLTESIDSAAVADQVSLGRFDIGAGNTVLAISQETPVDPGVAVASTHKWQVRINGASYYVLLSNV